MEANQQQVKINPFPESQGLSEIYQSQAVKMSFLRKLDNGEYIECNAPAQCRDFLHDIVYAAQTKTKYGIYGMSYDSAKYPLDLDVTRLCIRMPDRKAAEQFIKHIPYLHNIEGANGIAQSMILQVKELVFFVEGTAGWSASSVLVSLYTFILRLMAYDVRDVTDIAKGVFEQHGSTTDGAYLTRITLLVFDKIILNLKALTFDSFHGWPGTQNMHNFSGIVTYFTQNHNGFGAKFKEQNANYKQLKARGIF